MTIKRTMRIKWEGWWFVTFTRQWSSARALWAFWADSPSTAPWRITGWMVSTWRLFKMNQLLLDWLPWRPWRYWKGPCFFEKYPESRERAKHFVDNNRDKVPYCRKDYWCAEAYARVTFLIGMMHLIQSFAYWLPIHNIGELGLVWGAVVCASSLSAAVWIMFRMDVLPSHGGVFPIEIGGPIIEAISLALAYTHHPTAGVLDISRTLV